MTSFIHQNVYPIWAGCNACWPLLENYIPNSYNTLNPIAVTGFDNQMVLGYSSRYLIPKLDSVLTSLDLPVTRQENYRTEILPLIDSMNRWNFLAKKDTNLPSRCGQYLTVIKRQAEQKLSIRSYWMAVIENLITQNILYQTYDSNKNFAKSTRDYQMASNLKWLSENKYPNEKIIVWAANYHIAKYGDSTIKERTLISMGKYFTRDSALVNSTYIIGFNSYEGEAGRLGVKNYSVSKPKKNGFETWINESYNYAFVDLKRYTNTYSGKSEKFFMKGLGHLSFITDWTKIFDGIFYIKKMYPCNK